MIRKSIVVSIVVVALVFVGAVAVMAQDDGENTFPFGFGHGWMHQQDNQNFGRGMMHGGRGMMGGGFGPGMTDNHDATMTAFAEALGLEEQAFLDALAGGQTLAEIAEAQGVELEALQAVMLAQAAEHMNARVEAGDITQEQANEHLAWMSENIASMPMFSGEGFGGPCMGGTGGFANGMMGRHGQGMRWNNS